MLRNKDDELFKFELQLFAGDDLPGVNDDDDLDIDDENNEPEEEEETEDADLDEILKGLTGDDEDEEEPEDKGDPNDEPETEEEEEEPEKEPDVDEIVNQRVIAEVNRIIPERLARDRKTQEVTKLEHLTGMSLEQVTQTVIDNMVNQKAEELGISEEEARTIVTEKLENAGMKAERATEKQQQAEINTAMQQVNYLRDKTGFMAKPKLARILKNYEAEIDQFTQNGKVLTFEDGMKYVLGTKLATGELLNKVQAGAEQKAVRSMDKKRKAAPQSKSAGAKSETVSLTKEERQIAANLGISAKEYAAEKLRESNSKKRRSR